MRIGVNHVRRGNVLILFALLVFVLFAVAALSIDLGLVFLSRRQMQTAVDAAAREGLRFRDDIPAWLTDPSSPLGQQLRQEVGAGDVNDPAFRDKVRRWMARYQIAVTFTDGIDPHSGRPVQFGAGPEFQVAGGQGEANAFQTVAIPAPGDVVVYKPDVQMNLSNNPVGDLVSGDFKAGTPGTESADYQRLDFLPQTPGGDAFLVRLRRTKDPQGNDRNPADNQPGISTTGKALPLLFGQGTLIAGGDPTAGYSPRHHGITVRGTGIAQGRPVLGAGKAIPNDPAGSSPGMAGVAQFAIKLSDWLTLSTFTSTNVTFYQASSTRSTILVGDLLLASAAGALPGKDANQVYVPLVDDANRVAAFGYVSANPDGTLTKKTPMVASENATASTAIFRPDPADPTIPDPSDPAVLKLLTDLWNNPEPAQFLLAPVLVR